MYGLAITGSNAHTTEYDSQGIDLHYDTGIVRVIGHTFVEQVLSGSDCQFVDEQPPSGLSLGCRQDDMLVFETQTFHLDRLVCHVHCSLLYSKHACVSVFYLDVHSSAVFY